MFVSSYIVSCGQTLSVSFLLSTLPVRHWRAYTEGKACMRCLPKAKEPKKQTA